MNWIGFRRDPTTARGLATDPDLLDELIETEDDDACLDLDKAWHGIHWVLTGSAEETDDPASDAILGGDPIGEDLGYGPARLLGVDRVLTVAAVLGTLDLDALGARVDPARMREAEVYPDIWDELDVYAEYLRPALEELAEFYAAAAAAHEVVIQVVT
ncbi:MAG: YfbM family protein [Dermatophilaceae bacterium]